jgi:hypothetical protein
VFEVVFIIIVGPFIVARVAFAMAVRSVQVSTIIDLHNIAPSHQPVPCSIVDNFTVKFANQLERSFVVVVASEAFVASHIAVDFADFSWCNCSYQH